MKLTTSEGERVYTGANLMDGLNIFATTKAWSWDSPTNEEASANANELFRRWNSWEPNGEIATLRAHVAELRGALEACIPMLNLASHSALKVGDVMAAQRHSDTIIEAREALAASGGAA